MVKFVKLGDRETANYRTFKSKKEKRGRKRDPGYPIICKNKKGRRRIRHLVTKRETFDFGTWQNSECERKRGKRGKHQD